MNQTIGVNITPQSFQPTLHYSQGDVGRVFVINVTDYDIPTGATVTCVATKPSGMGFTVSGTVSGNSVTFTSTAEMTDEWGRFPAEIRIASGNTLLGTANFLMIGEKDPHPASTIDGTQEELIPQLTLLVNRVEAAAESVHDLTVSATTLAAGSDATATYDSANNSIAFGIPRGADGDVTRSEFNDLKSDLIDAEHYLYENTVTKQDAPFAVAQGTDVLATRKLIFVDIPSGTKFKYKISGTTGTLVRYAIYYYDANGTRTNFAQYRALNTEYEYTAPTDIKSLAIYCSSSEVTASETLTISVSFISYTNANSVESQLTKIDEKIDNPYITLAGKFVYGSLTAEANHDNTRARSVYTKKVTGNLLVKGFKSLGYAIAVMVWSDAPFGTVVYNSGFLVTDELNYPLDNVYVGIATRTNPDSSSALDLNVINSLSVEAYVKLSDSSNPIIKMDSDIASLRTDSLLMQTVKTIAHKGDQIVAPQCTAPSYITARKRGIRIAEGDVNLSEDGQYVIWHDTTFWLLGNLVDINGYLMYTDGTNYYYVNPSDSAVYTWDGSQYVASSVALSSLTRCGGWAYGVKSGTDITGLPLAVLKRIDFGAYKGYAGAQILTFSEWVDLCKQLGMEMYIDTKISYTTEQITELANIVKAKGMGNLVSWFGIDVDKIPTLRQVLPNSRIGVLQHPNSSNIVAYSQYNVGRGVFFNGDAKNGLSAEAVQLGLNAGYEVESWYVDYGSATETEIMNVIRQAVSCGVTAMTLDHYTVDDAFEYLYE